MLLPLLFQRQLAISDFVISHPVNATHRGRADFEALGSGQTPEELVEAILRAVRGLQYGTLEVVVHDFRIVRIERRERIRLDVEPEGVRKTLPTARAEAQLPSTGLDRIEPESLGPERK